jgi:hypothetical protein
MMGRNVAFKRSDGESITIVTVPAGTGYYLVKVQSGDQFFTRKVFIR